jgi:hypothetical protein
LKSRTGRADSSRWYAARSQREATVDGMDE